MAEKWDVWETYPDLVTATRKAGVIENQGERVRIIQTADGFRVDIYDVTSDTGPKLWMTSVYFEKDKKWHTVDDVPMTKAAAEERMRSAIWMGKKAKVVKVK